MKSKVIGRAPINIALIKYWGKKDEIEVIPFQPSISLSLDVFESETTITKTKNDKFEFFLNGKENSEENQKIKKFLNYFSDDLNGVKVESKNTGPTAAGLASSASGFAALAITANRFFEKKFNLEKLSTITRKGSGSAIRSLLPGCVKWNSDGSLSKLTWPFNDIRVGISIISDKKKQIGSTKAMATSVKTSKIYNDWINQSFIDAELFEFYKNKKDFTSLGELFEKNALLMHKVCELSNPKIQYLTSKSYELIRLIQNSRKKGIFEAFVTMDAGPNVKIITKEKNINTISELLISKGYNVLWSNIDTEGAKIIYESES